MRNLLRSRLAVPPAATPAPATPAPATPHHSTRRRLATTNLRDAVHEAAAAPLVAGPGCAFPCARIAIAMLLVLGAAVGAARAQGLSQDFDGVTSPDLPAGWSDGTGWVTSTSSVSTGSGANNLAHTGTGADNVVSESFSLVGWTDATVSYLARRTSSYPIANLVVTASIDAGATWTIPVIASGNGLPAASSEWVLVDAAVPAALLGEPDVRLRFEGAGGTSSGANIRIDDVTIVEGAAGQGGGGGGTSIGFSSSASTVPESSLGYDVDVALTVDAAAGLAAFQFTASWDDPLLTLTEILPGAAVSNLAEWNVSGEPGAQTLTVLALGQSGASLASGAYDPVITLRFDVGALPEGIPIDVTLTMSNAIGALAVAEGTDAAMTLSRATHIVTVARRAGVFSAPSPVAIGEALVGSNASAVVTVSNTGGTADLSISSVLSDQAAFTVVPATATIAPEASADFTVTFTPTALTVGPQTATLTFSHDGSNGPTGTVSVTATGSAGRGDANADAIVDIADVLIGVDVALGRVTPTVLVLSSLDLYPFPVGDGSVDVRDLTVIVQAILVGQWPDGLPLPVPPAGKRAVIASGGPAVRLRVTEATISVVSSEPLRALQFDLIGPDVGTGGGDSPRALTIAGKASVQVGVIPGRARVLWVSLDGAELPSGETPIAEFPGMSARVGGSQGTGSGDAGLALGYATAIASDGTRRAVVLDVPDAEALPALAPPYPNPFSPGSGDRLTIPLLNGRPGAWIEVLDVLGRRVRRLVAETGAESITWDGRDAAGATARPGLYFLRAPAAGNAATRTVVLLW